MTFEYRVRTNALLGFERLVESLGGSPGFILKQYNLTLDSLTSERQTMRTHDVVKLLNQSADEFDCPIFGLKLSQLQDFRVLGPLGIIAENCETPREAIQALESWMLFHNQSEIWSTALAQNVILIQRTDSFDELADTRQYKELAMGACLSTSRSLLGDDFKPKRVEFSHSPLTSESEYEQLLKLEVVFNSEYDTLVVEDGFLDLPIKHTNKELKEAKLQYLRRIEQQFGDDIERQVSSLIYQTISVQLATIDNIARLLSLSKRSLQRRLKAKGVNFKGLVEDIRYRSARKYLKTSTMDIIIIAQRLGYSDAGNFSRAFKKKSGLSPRKWRLKHQNST